MSTYPIVGYLYSVAPNYSDVVFVNPTDITNDQFITLEDVDIGGNHTYDGLGGLYCRVNFEETGIIFTQGSGGTGGATYFTDLLDCPANYSGSAGYFCQVNSGSTGLQFAPLPAPDPIPFTDLTDVPSSFLNCENFFVTVNDSATGLDFVQTPILNFEQLANVPQSLEGQANKFLTCKGDQTGLQFTSVAPTSTTFVTLTDCPNSYVGQAQKFVKVSDTEDSLVFVQGMSGAGVDRFTQLLDTFTFANTKNALCTVNTTQTALYPSSFCVVDPQTNVNLKFTPGASMKYWFTDTNGRPNYIMRPPYSFRAQYSSVETYSPGFVNTHGFDTATSLNCVAQVNDTTAFHRIGTNADFCHGIYNNWAVGYSSPNVASDQIWNPDWTQGIIIFQDFRERPIGDTALYYVGGAQNNNTGTRGIAFKIHIDAYFQFTNIPNQTNQISIGIVTGPFNTSPAIGNDFVSGIFQGDGGSKRANVSGTWIKELRPNDFVGMQFCYRPLNVYNSQPVSIVKLTITIDEL